MVKKIYSFLFLFLICAKMNASEAKGPFVIGGYFESWSQFSEGVGGRGSFSLERINPSLLTDLYFAFAIFGYTTNDVDGSGSGLTGDFSLRPLYPTDPEKLYPQMRELKRRSGGALNLFLSVGGSNFNDPKDPFGMGSKSYRLFSSMVSSAESRKEFIDSAIAYLHRYGFDGIDIDWEFPGDLTRGGSEGDFEGFILLLQELAAAFRRADPPLLLSFCLPPKPPGGLPSPYRDNPDRFFSWAARCGRFADRITLMTYNYHTPLGESRLTGANAPLLRDTSPNSDLYVAKTLDDYLSHGMEPEKLLLGIPLYGWLYRGVEGMREGDTGPGKRFYPHIEEMDSTLPYFLIADKIAEKKFLKAVDPITDTAYCYGLKEKLWLSFDTPETALLKMKAAKKRGLKGVVFWAVNQDEYEWDPIFPHFRKAAELFER